MVLRRRGFVVCGGGLLCAGILLAAASVARAEGPDETAAREVREWRDLIARGRVQIVRNGEIVDSISRDLPRLAPRARQRALEMVIRFHRLIALYGARGKTPVSLRNMRAQVRSLEYRTAEIIAPIEKRKELLASIEQFYDRILDIKSTLDRGSLGAVLPPGVAPDIAAFRREGLALKTRLVAVKRELSARLEAAYAFRRELRDYRSLLDAEEAGVLRNYYLEPSPRLFNVDGLRAALAVLVARARLLGKADPSYSQYDAGVWHGFSVRVAIVFLACAVAFVLALRAAERRVGLPGLVSRLLPAAAWLAAGAGVLAGIQSPEFVRAALFSAAAWLLLGGGLISLGARLRAGNHAAGARFSGLLRLFWGTVAAGVILQALNIPSEAIALVWAPTLVLAWVFVLRLPAGGTAAYLASRRALLCLFPILALCALSGRTAPALSLSTLLLVFCLCVVLADVVAAVRTHLFRAAADPAASSLASRIIGAVITPPNVFLAAFYGAAAGYLLYMGGRPLLQALAGFSVGIRHVSLGLVNVPLIVGLYLLSRSAVAVAREMIPVLYRGDDSTRQGAILSLCALSSYLIWIAFSLAALSLVGFTPGNLALVAGGLSVGIGFGMQHIISNFVSGLILLLGRAIQPGDMIDRDGNFSRVEQVTLRSTFLRTYDGKTIIVPNSEFIIKSFSNWTYRDPRIRGNIAVKVAASADSRKVEELLLAVARAHPNVLEFPVPSVRLEGFSQGNLEFSLRVWVAHPRDWKVVSELRHDVFRALRERNIAAA